MDLVIPVLLVIKDEMQLNNKRKDTNKYKGNKRKKKFAQVIVTFTNIIP